MCVAYKRRTCQCHRIAVHQFCLEPRVFSFLGRSPRYTPDASQRRSTDGMRASIRRKMLLAVIPRMPTPARVGNKEREKETASGSHTSEKEQHDVNQVYITPGFPPIPCKVQRAKDCQYRSCQPSVDTGGSCCYPIQIHRVEMATSHLEFPRRLLSGIPLFHSPQ